MTVLGIDPGTTRIGFGIVSRAGGEFRHIDSGLLPVPRADGAVRLAAIQGLLRDLVRRARPDRACVERLFVTRNHRTVIAVSEARGAILAALAECGIPVIEPTPSAVKLAVTGNGRASKSAVARMVRATLGMKRIKITSASRGWDDVTDALAIAITGSQSHPCVDSSR